MAILGVALLGGHELDHLLTQWGYGLILAVAALQSLGAPLPGTTALISGALYAGSTHRLEIVVVIAAGSAGALLGGLVSYAAGRRGGAALLDRHGAKVGLSAQRLRIGRLLFNRYGSRIVFFGRFITGLRNIVGFLSGTNRMAFWRFMTIYAGAALVWALTNGLGYYFFGRALRSASTPVDVALAVLFVASLLLTGSLGARGWRSVTRQAGSPAEAPPGDRPAAEHR